MARVLRIVLLPWVRDLPPACNSYVNMPKKILILCDVDSKLARELSFFEDRIPQEVFRCVARRRLVFRYRHFGTLPVPLSRVKQAMKKGDLKKPDISQHSSNVNVKMAVDFGSCPFREFTHHFGTFFSRDLREGVCRRG